MKELSILTSDSIGEKNRNQLMLLVCDESSIQCITFRKLVEVVVASGLGAVLVMPDYQYQRGLRGWAKAQILASVTNKIQGVMPISHEVLERELKSNWASIRLVGPITWNRTETQTYNESQPTNLTITETDDPFDREMIDRTKSATKVSNCWMDPAGCVFVRGREILVESTSTSFNDSQCTRIPLRFEEIPLNAGERMIFCDSLHSERVGISQAAEKGISLKGSTMYVTKFPCRPCLQSAIAAGVTTITFDKGSYGLTETADLVKSNNISLKKVVN